MNVKELFDTVDVAELRVNETVKLLQVSRVAYHKWRKVPDRKPHPLFLSRANMLVQRANELVSEGLLPMPKELGPKDRWGLLEKLFPALIDK